MRVSRPTWRGAPEVTGIRVGPFARDGRYLGILPLPARSHPEHLLRCLAQPTAHPVRERQAGQLRGMPELLVLPVGQAYHHLSRSHHCAVISRMYCIWYVCGVYWTCPRQTPRTELRRPDCNSTTVIPLTGSLASVPSHAPTAHASSAASPRPNRGITGPRGTPDPRTPPQMTSPHYVPRAMSSPPR